MSTPCRAVVIDDTEMFRTLLRLALTRAGIDVVAEAGDGRSGIATVAATQPDLVVLDLGLPDLDGLEVLPQLHDASPASRVLVLSGHGRHSSAGAAALQAGAADYLQKGAAPSVLVERVRELLSRPTADAGSRG